VEPFMFCKSNLLTFVLSEKTRYIAFPLSIIFAMIGLVHERVFHYMNEFEFIDSIKQGQYRHPSIVKGIGDDAAVFRSSYQDIVTAVDSFVENVHFSRKTMDPYHIGYRILATNISDMAAMGAEPISYLTSIIIPNDWNDQELREIYQGL